MIKHAVKVNAEYAFGWYSTADLTLQGELVVKWDEFLSRLSLAGINLSDSSDDIVWCLNKKRGDVTTNLAYNALVD